MVHAILTDQPTSVHEISASLYAPYKVDNGSIHLAGCSLEDVGILVDSNSADSNGFKLYYLDGSPCDPKLYDQLGLDRNSKVAGLEAIKSQPSARDEIQVQLKQLIEEKGIETVGELLVVWGKWADGKLVVEIGSQTAEIAFHGWARQFVEGPLRPPPFVCKLTGLQSYEITTDDEGTITVPEAIERCEITGQRLVRSKLGQCTVTGTLALKTELKQCAASGQFVTQNKLANCWTCYQPTDPKSMKMRKCLACQHTEQVPTDNEQLQQLFEHYPRLKQASNFKVGHAGQRTVVLASLDAKKLKLVSNDNCASTHVYLKKWPFGYRAMNESEVEDLLAGQS